MFFTSTVPIRTTACFSWMLWQPAVLLPWSYWHSLFGEVGPAVDQGRRPMTLLSWISCWDKNISWDYTHPQQDQRGPKPSTHSQTTLRLHMQKSPEERKIRRIENSSLYLYICSIYTNPFLSASGTSKKAHFPLNFPQIRS